MCVPSEGVRVPCALESSSPTHPSGRVPRTTEQPPLPPAGDIEAKPEIVLPKSFRPQAAVPPPPVPVHQQPLYLQRQQQGFGRGGGGYRPAGQPAAFQQQAPPTQPNAAQSAAVQAAIEQAKAIAARLAGQAPGGQPGGGQGGQPGGQQQWQWGSR